MGIESIFATAAGDLMDQADTAATYTPTVGAAVSCRVHVIHTTESSPDGMQALTWETRTVIDALHAEVGRPAKGSTFLVATTTYTVVEVMADDGVFVVLAVK